MTIKQLSVFLENKTGRINEVAKTLSKHGINMRAFSMAETTDFGILRLIVSDVDKAAEVLRAENFAVMLTDVAYVACPNESGALAEILDKIIFAEFSKNSLAFHQPNLLIREKLSMQNICSKKVAMLWMFALLRDLTATTILLHFSKNPQDKPPLNTAS